MDWKKTAKILFVVFSFIAPAFAGVSLDDIAVGATYRMTLTTGDVLEGVVDSKTDSSLILDCKGSAYTFASTLIAESQLLAPPAAKTAGQPGAAEPVAITYDQAKQKQPGASLQVKIKSGAVFNGTLVSADNGNLKLNIDGSVIPIDQQVIDQIFVVTAQKAPDRQSASAPAAPPQVYDTLIVKNPESDDYGRSKENLTVIGKIIKEDNLRLTIMRTDNQQTSYTFDQILRIYRHTAENPEEDQIKRYAKPLFCPPDMVLVDLPQGKANRPFFKVCIDKYEYPNRLGTVPQVNVNFEDAQKLCEQAGKRLCTSQEWQWSCSGMEGYTYPYGINLEKENCNMEGSKVIEPSGNRNKCISKFGAIDMTGNVFEWVKGKEGAAAAMGGPLSKCSTISPGAGGGAKATIGLRCCKSN
jgi:hypothetical protein